MTKAVLLGSFFLMVCQMAWAGETIIGHEVEGYFYSDGLMKESRGQFEITYYLEGDTVTRTRVYDLIKKEVLPDDTVYRIQRQLVLDPTKGTSLYSYPFGETVIRAIGQPGTDAIEILVIGKTFIQSVKSTADYFVISRYKRIK